MKTAIAIEEGKGDRPDPNSSYVGIQHDEPNPGGWYREGQTCGEQALGLHIEGFGIMLTGPAAKYYDVKYRCKPAAEDFRDGMNGSYCGTRGQLKQLQQASLPVACKPEYCEQP
jgi:hypothetical protein